MRRKLTAAVFLAAFFAMNANAYCAGLCAGRHGHASANDAQGEGGHGGEHMAHSCHHNSRPGSEDRDKPHACRTSAHEGHGAAAEVNEDKPARIDASGAIIECNCTDEPSESAQGAITLKERTLPSYAHIAAVAAAAFEARPLLSEYSPPEGPPKIS